MPIRTRHPFAIDSKKGSTCHISSRARGSRTASNALSGWPPKPAALPPPSPAAPLPALAPPLSDESASTPPSRARLAAVRRRSAGAALLFRARRRPAVASSSPSPSSSKSGNSSLPLSSCRSSSSEPPHSSSTRCWRLSALVMPRWAPRAAMRAMRSAAAAPLLRRAAPERAPPCVRHHPACPFGLSHRLSRGHCDIRTGCDNGAEPPKRLLRGRED
mmetsp:Transcript_7147/g.23431  ORF Transcript_7147/g.23431 Transcript_7147/m.23431 type:complete len:217 (-) Transcript_7147:4-654(-)